MKKSTFHKVLMVLITLLFATIISLLVIRLITVKSDEKKEQKVTLEDSQNVVIECDGFNENTDSWVTLLQMSEDEEDTLEVTGATLAITIRNHQHFSIRNWHLRINVTDELYLNGFWCGTFEIHQFRDGKEIVETVNSNSFDLSTMQLEHNEYTNALFVHLQPGDYLIYNPSTEANEDVISGHGYVGIGYIAYFTEVPELRNCELSYYNDRKFADGTVFNFIILLSLVLVMLIVLHLMHIITYRKAANEIEVSTRSLIEGLSVEYQTLWLINVSQRTIQLIRNMNTESINKAVSVAKDYEDYNVAIKHYIDNYVDESDRERVWENVEFDALVNHLKEEAFYTVNFLSNPLDDESTYLQMVFTKAVSSGNERIVLAYRNIDKMVKEDQQKNKILQEALLEAERANRSKTAFLANMSHEIRTPINAILGMNTMILRESGEESIKEYARDIKTASNTLLTIVNDILDFSKIESGKIELIEAQYRLDSVINDLTNMIKSRADEKGLKFNVKINPSTPIELLGDEIRVKQIILNLLTNAVKYTHEGSVTWAIDYELLSENKCKLHISVRDTGMGIKKEDMDKLFSPYARLEENANHTIEGTGLGLSITKSLLEKMDSELKLESVYKEGSVFSFDLIQPMYGKLQMQQCGEKKCEKEEQTEKYHAPKAKVLVVDDINMNLIVIKNLLKRVGIAPDLVSRGKEALNKCNEKRYDIIFLDAMMPEMSGEETLKCIREQSDLNSDTPIVILTANALVGAKEEYLSKGFTDYLSKPVEGRLLEAMIAQYIDPQLLEAPDTVSKTTDNTGAKGQKGFIDFLRKAQTINVDEGIMAAGDISTYNNVCDSFYRTADDRMDMIKEALDKGDIDNCNIQVHALKSSARLVGAMELSKQALDMEIACREKNVDYINQNSQKLIADYREIKAVIGEALLCMESSDETAKKEISEAKLIRKLSELNELVEAFDFESAKELVKKIGDFRLNEDFKKVYSKIRVLMAEVDRDAILKTVGDYLREKKQ